MAAFEKFMGQAMAVSRRVLSARAAAPVVSCRGDASSVVVRCPPHPPIWAAPSTAPRIALGLYLRVSATPPRPALKSPIAARMPIRFRATTTIWSSSRCGACAAHEQCRTAGRARSRSHNQIPLGVGLGSSAAAIVAGIAAGSRAVRCQARRRIGAAPGPEIEGHPDNVAAAVHGGMVVAATARSRRACSSPKPPSRRVSISSPSSPRCRCPRKKRAPCLPAQYSRKDVVGNLQRTALLTACFFSGGRTLAGIVSRPPAPALSQPAGPRHRAVSGVSPRRSGRDFPERRGFGGDGHRAARRGGNRQGAGGRIPAQRSGPAALLLKADNRGAEVSRSLRQASRGAQLRDAPDRRHRNCEALIASK